MAPTDMTTQQLLLFIFGAVLSSSAVTAIINHLVSRSQNKAKEVLDKVNAAKVVAETEQIELETEQKLNDFYEDQINKLLKKIQEFQDELKTTKDNYNQALKELKRVSDELEDNKKQMAVVLKMLRKKENEGCLRVDCPTRLTKNK